MVIISKNYVLALLISHLSFLLKKTSLWGLLKWWAGVDSNHRSLATADLQSAPFSHSGTYPYLIINKFAFDGIWTRGLSLTKGVRYPCATKAFLFLFFVRSLGVLTSQKRLSIFFSAESLRTKASATRAYIIKGLDL